MALKALIFIFEMIIFYDTYVTAKKSKEEIFKSLFFHCLFLSSKKRKKYNNFVSFEWLTSTSYQAEILLGKMKVRSVLWWALKQSVILRWSLDSHPSLNAGIILVFMFFHYINCNCNFQSNLNCAEEQNKTTHIFHLKNKH